MKQVLALLKMKLSIYNDRYEEAYTIDIARHEEAIEMLKTDQLKDHQKKQELLRAIAILEQVSGTAQPEES